MSFFFWLPPSSPTSFEEEEWWEKEESEKEGERQGRGIKSGRETVAEAGLSLDLSVLVGGEGQHQGEVTSRRGKEAPWVNCAASRSPKRRRKSVSVSCSRPHAWVCVVGESSWN